MDKGTTLEQMGLILGRVLKAKNIAYGDSFAKSPRLLEFFFPNGIKPEQYGIAIFILRLGDKIGRMVANNDPGGENPVFDIAGYAMLQQLSSIKSEEDFKQFTEQYKDYLKDL